jgi:N-dimethylarginine dimethylaminohydrolase
MKVRTALFCPPTYFDIVDVKNPFMSGNAGVNRELALAQWSGVQDAFRAAGCETATIDAAEGLEDMVFSANQTFVGEAAGKKFVVPSQMRHPSRRREVPHYLNWFRTRGYEVIEIKSGEEEFLEGGGDLLWDEDRRFVWAGYGFRSTKPAIAKLQSTLSARGVELVPLQLADERFYHLDTCLAPLPKGAVLIYPAAFTSEALANIRKHATRVYAVQEEDALGFVCNGVTAGDYFITPRITPSLQAALQGEEMMPLIVNTSEFERSGGSVCCLKQWI